MTIVKEKKTTNNKKRGILRDLLDQKVNISVENLFDFNVSI